jgi:hypothetical protein
MSNAPYYGDHLAVLRESTDSERVDLVSGRFAIMDIDCFSQPRHITAPRRYGSACRPIAADSLQITARTAGADELTRRQPGGSTARRT